MIDVSIVICTFNRPELLARSVDSCLGQVTLLAFEIIVVDNSVDSNARRLIQTIADSDGRVKYVALPQPNISLARNAGIAEARGEFVAFLDDDEEAIPHWLDHLVTTARDAKADGAIAPVRPRFQENPPSWDPLGWYFTRFADLPSGTIVNVSSRPRQTARWVGTGNSLIRRSVCAGDVGVFDPRLGLTGGEDTEFFGRMARCGRRIVWCATAVVSEFVPTERAKLSYMLERWARGAQLVVRFTSENRRWPWLTVAAFMIRGLLQTIVGTLLSAVARPFSTRLATLARFRAAAGRGMLASWHRRPPHA